MKRLIAIMLAMSFALPVEGQVRRRLPRSPQPVWWTTLSVGLFNGNDVSDGETRSTWDFGQASTPQGRFSVERAFGSSASVGAAATYTRVPFTYHGTGGDNGCSRCAAHLDVLTLGASFHVGGGYGLHQVLEGSAGVLQYRNLERDSDGAALAPVDGNVDPYFTFGYGFGYGFNSRMHASVVQDFGLALHERSGLTSEQSNTLRQRTLRLNVRYGLGNRRR